MAEHTTVAYNPGDWIVHLHHGVGHIACIEEKELGGDTSTYYKVVTDDSTLWVPLDKADNRWFRPVCTREEFDEILAILQRSPQEMHKNHLARKRRITNVKSDGSLEETARIIRDLWGRRAERQLNNTEETALRRFTDRLVREWAVCMGVDESEARERMQELLQRSTTHA
jgi:CarD family transcriptional regulator